MNAINDLSHFQAIFEQYADGLTQGDISQIHPYHAYPWILVKGEEHHVISSKGMFAQQFALAKAILDQQGISEIHAEIKKAIVVTEKNKLVNVLWHYIDSDQQVQRTFSTSYLFVENQGREHIMSVVIDDDEDIDISLFG